MFRTLHGDVVVAKSFGHLRPVAVAHVKHPKRATDALLFDGREPRQLAL
jgi:Iap family predicted aminopeptidase